MGTMDASLDSPAEQHIDTCRSDIDDLGFREHANLDVCDSGDSWINIVSLLSILLGRLACLLIQLQQHSALRAHNHASLQFLAKSVQIVSIAHAVVESMRQCETNLVVWK